MMNAMADLAATHAWQEKRPGVYGRDILLRREPVGVVAAVIPWNMPQFLTITKVIPALLAGCTVIVKPAPEAPLDALVLADLVDQAGLPPGVVNVVPADRDSSAHLVGHAGIDKVSFTGSTAAGRQVAAACARNLTKVSLELAGKSAAIALEDADPGAVATAVRLSGMGMAGQICNALTRVLAPSTSPMPSARNFPPSRSVIPLIPRPRWAHSWRAGSRNGYGTTSIPAYARAPRSRPEAPTCPPRSAEGGTCAPQCSAGSTPR
jgi:acyl-CoA reductase-like NAD-dependent aldehyde dehydrogenase